MAFLPKRFYITKPLCSSVIVGTDYNTNKKRIWGEGRVQKLVEAKELYRATALMINVDMLSPVQQVMCFFIVLLYS